MSDLTEAVLAQLLDRLDGPSTAKELAEVRRAWEDETLRIARELDEGRMELVPWDQVRAEIFGKRGQTGDEPVPTSEELAENEAAWEEEVLRIAREHDEGRAKFLPWDEVRARVFGEREG